MFTILLLNNKIDLFLLYIITTMSEIESVYNTIASDFDKKRYSVWKCVQRFLDSLTSDAHMLEVGCGNGKNMLYRKDIQSVGIDISEEQVSICKSKGLHVEKANMTCLPFDDATFDAIICIAVYHHLQSDDERKKSLEEMYRVLKPNGKIMLTVWAMEQEDSSKRKFISSDSMVSYKINDSTHYRYYHIYSEGMLQDEVQRLSTFSVEKVSYELGNWCIILTKM
jgi:ubiquinone/menaquinone biosynthesis C-methylase UbiE